MARIINVRKGKDGRVAHNRRLPNKAVSEGSDMKPMGQKIYEIELKSNKNTFDEEYGFGSNPPITIMANNKKEAINKLKLPKSVKINKIKQIN